MTPDWNGERGEQWRDGLDGIEATLAPVDAPLLDALALDGAQRIADLGCGGGGTTIAIHRRAPHAIVHGFDLSPALIEAARARTGAVTFARADLVTAPPPDVLYDRLTSRFGIMFFDDPGRAFGNVARWLAPGGRFAFAVWAASEDSPWMHVVREIAARFVKLPSAEPDAPGPFRYGDARPLCGLLASAGLTGIETRGWRGDLPIGGGLAPAEAAAFALGSFGSFARLFADAPADSKRDAVRAIAEHYASHVRDGAVWMGASVHIVTGKR